jgi:hypothetical protein
MESLSSQPALVEVSFHRFPLVAVVYSGLRLLLFFMLPFELAANQKFPQMESRNFPSAESCF